MYLRVISFSLFTFYLLFDVATDDGRRWLKATLLVVMVLSVAMAPGLRAVVVYSRDAFLLNRQSILLLRQSDFAIPTRP